MELVTYLIDFILHVDKYLEAFITQYGLWVYALLSLIIFVETGVVVMPFLPGDSLLFVVGAMCGVGLMSYPLSVGLLFAAAVLGNQSNYAIGRHFGPKVFQWEDSRFFNRRGGAVHAIFAHLRPVCCRGRPNDACPLPVFRHAGWGFVGRRHCHHWLFLWQLSLG
jgi:hypothetical protein